MTLQRRQWLLLAALAAGVARGHAATNLRFGVVPYLTARRLATLYEPARNFFEQTLARPVQFSSAPDYTVHLQRLREQAYDLVADSPTFARLAQRELGYVPLARTVVPLQPILVMGEGKALSSVAALRGQTVAVSDRMATLTVVGLRFLRDQGLQPDQDVTIKVAGSHVNAIQRVLAGEAAAAIVSRTTLKQIEVPLASRMRLVMALPQALSAVVYTVSPALAAQAPTLAQRLLAFANQDPVGKAFIAALGHEGLVPAGREMAQVDPLVVEFYRQLNNPD
ncbi:phosphate/phosphite/phosphonate ABC transporter substrate-binding protein [Hydrogenophaga soli]